jgi:predicted transcriptional regulator of viral defense system
VLSEIRAHEQNTVLRRHSVKALIAQLTATRVLVPLEALEFGEGPDQLFAVGLGTDPDSLDPIDLLMALEPTGVVCYFTALVVHQLTTQIPVHHHVARLVWRNPKREALALREPATDTVAAPTRKLGTLRAQWRGVSYYSTQRDLSKVVGISVQYMNDRLRCRVTSLEQTLLDTLLRPASCGGPPQVFEAWEAARRQAQPDKLLALLERIDHPELWRRAGYMLEDQRFPLGPDQQARLDQMERQAGNALPVPLLPGLPYTHPSRRWQLLLP